MPPLAGLLGSPDFPTTHSTTAISRCILDKNAKEIVPHKYLGRELEQENTSRLSWWGAASWTP